MKFKLTCRIFGHDFRHIEDTIVDYSRIRRTISPGNFCRKCGLTKEDITKINS